MCDLLPRAYAEKIMGKALVQQRNDASGCHYEDARGTTGTGLWIYLNAFEVSDQCRLTPRSEPVSTESNAGPAWWGPDAYAIASSALLSGP